MAGPWSSAGGGSRLSFKLQVPLRQFAAKRQISSRSFQVLGWIRMARSKSDRRLWVNAIRVQVIPTLNGLA